MDGREGKSEWAEAVGAIALVCLLASLALVAAGGWSWFAKLLDTSAPAWVQAIGSVGAILATGWSVRRMHQMQQAQRSKEIYDANTRLLETAFYLVASSRHRASKIEGYETPYRCPPESRRAMQAELAALHEGFKRFDCHQLEQVDYVRAVIAADACIRLLLSTIEVELDPTFKPLADNVLALQANQTVQSLTAHAALLNDALNRREGRDTGAPVSQASHVGPIN